MRALIGFAICAALAGCAAVPGLGEPNAGEPARTPVDGNCQTDAYAYYGTTTIAELGLDGAASIIEVPPEYLHRRGQIWVTQTRITLGGEELRMLCAEYPEGDQLSYIPIDDSWVSPTAEVDFAVGVSAPQVLALALAAVAIIAASVLLYRRQTNRPG
jgi:hypothetical protein